MDRSIVKSQITRPHTDYIYCLFDRITIHVNFFLFKIVFTLNYEHFKISLINSNRN